MASSFYQWAGKNQGKKQAGKKLWAIELKTKKSRISVPEMRPEQELNRLKTVV